MSVSATKIACSRVKEFRERQGWTQAELAARSALSRPEISAIETGRLAPSVGAALTLARVFSCTVEALFETERQIESAPEWAWRPAGASSGVWLAEVGGRTLAYPVELTEQGCVAHDGVWDGKRLTFNPVADSRRTLVLATCDPAVGLLAGEMARVESVRLIALVRPSRAAIQLLAQGLVHGAGVHLASTDQEDGNAPYVREILEGAFRLVRLANLKEGVVVRQDCGVKDARAAARTLRRWVWREEGSGARQCQEQLLQGRITPKHVVHDHRTVAETVRSGLVDAGVCLEFTARQLGLSFLPVREEPFDLCFTKDFVSDPRYCSLQRVLRSQELRRLLSGLPGYDTSMTGEVVPASKDGQPA